VNAVDVRNSLFTDCDAGFYIQDIGSGTTASEAVKFMSTQFEQCGHALQLTGVGTVSAAAGAATFSTSQAGIAQVGSQVVVAGTTYTLSAFNGTTGGTLSGAPTFGASAFTIRKPWAVGSFGLKSDMYTGQMDIDSCYFEANGNSPTDTTGTNVYCRAPWNLGVRNCIFATSNNQIWMAFGGQAKVEGNYFVGGANMTSIFVLDSPQPGSDLSNLEVGKNKWGAAYSSAQLFRFINGSLTKITGYTDALNYLTVPPRQNNQVLRDASSITADAGAIGMRKIKRLADNAGGSTTIATTHLASICKNTVSAMILITEYGNSAEALFLCTPGGGIVLVAQRGTLFTTTLNNAATLNVVNDAGTGTWLVQNNLAGSALLAASIFGNEPMEHADDGYYETQFA
jgi:hypothetical protein